MRIKSLSMHILPLMAILAIAFGCDDSGGTSADGDSALMAGTEASSDKAEQTGDDQAGEDHADKTEQTGDGQAGEDHADDDKEMATDDSMDDVSSDSMADTAADADKGFGHYVIGTVVRTPEASQSFVAFAKDIASTDTVMLDDAIEAGSAGGVFAAGDGTGVFFTAEEGGTLQRWRATSTAADDDPMVERDGSINFSDVGLTSFFPTPTHVQFISETKAYLMNSLFGEIIVWDPSTLEVLGTIETGLPTEVLGTPGDFSLSGVSVGDDTLMFTYNYARPDALRAESYLVVIDTTDDTVETDHTVACGDLQYGVAADNGDVYWASSFYQASLFRIDESMAPAPCLLRVASGTAEFADTGITLNELSDGFPAGNLVPAGGNKALVLVYDENEVPIAADADVFAVVGAPAWRWWSLDLETLEASELDGSTAGSGQTVHYDVDGESYVIRVAPDYSTSTFERVVSNGAPVPGLTITGAARFGLVKP